MNAPWTGNHTFAEALASLLAGRNAPKTPGLGQRISRAVWEDTSPGLEVYAIWPKLFDFVTWPYMVLLDSTAKFRIWTPTNDDLFATDWRIHQLEIFLSSPNDLA